MEPEREEVAVEGHQESDPSYLPPPDSGLWLSLMVLISRNLPTLPPSFQSNSQIQQWCFFMPNCWELLQEGYWMRLTLGRSTERFIRQRRRHRSVKRAVTPPRGEQSIGRATEHHLKLRAPKSLDPGITG